MKTFAERNPLKLAAFGLLFIVLTIAAVFNIDDLPLIGGGGTTYEAEFLDAGGLSAGDRVEVAGVLVGKVAGIEIEDDKIVVAFDIDETVRLGSESQAAVKVGELLGTKFLDLVPSGDDRLPARSRIPLERTTEAYDVVTAFADLTENTERLDTKRVADAMDTMSSLFEETPDEVAAAMRGIAGFSRTIASRDDVIRELMSHAASTTKVLENRSGDISALIKDATLLVRELDARRSAIHGVLVNTRNLAKELRGLAAENQSALAPALTELEKTVDLMLEHQADLTKTVQNIAVYSRVFNNTLGAGPWFDSWLPNVPDTVTKSEVK